MDPRFGITKIPKEPSPWMEKETPFKEVMDKVEVSNSIMSQQILLEAYDTTHGHFNHDEDLDGNPLAIVSLHPNEDVLTNSPLYNELKFYQSHGVRTEFGLSLTEFLALPYDICRHLLDLCVENSANKTKQINEIEERLSDG